MRELMKKNPLVNLLAVVLVLSVTFVLVTNTVWAANPKQTVGYIDMEKIQKSLPELQDFQNLAQSKDVELNSFVQYVQTQFNNDRARLEKERDQKKQGKSAEEKSAIDKEYNEKLQKALEENQNKIQNERTRLSAELQREYDKVMSNLNSIVEKVAAEAGVTVVLEKKLIFYGGMDLTDKVIAEAQKENK
jgi:outer membrane protein